MLPGDHIVIVGGTHKGKRAQFISRCSKFIRVRIDNWRGVDVTTISPTSAEKSNKVHEIFLKHPFKRNKEQSIIEELSCDFEFRFHARRLQGIIESYGLENKGSIVGEAYNHVMETSKLEEVSSGVICTRHQDKDYYVSS